MRKAFDYLASANFTLWLLALLLIILPADALNITKTTILRSLALSLLGVNMFLCLVKRRKFFLKKRALLFFHVGLLSTGILALCASLVYYNVSLRIPQDKLVSVRAEKPNYGWWYPKKIRDIQVEVKNIDYRFWKGSKPKDFSGKINIWLDAGDGYVDLVKSGIASPNNPVIYKGVKFFITSVSGFSAHFAFIDEAGRTNRGYLQMPDYKMNFRDQSEKLIVPGVDLDMEAKLVMQPIIGNTSDWALVVPNNPKIEISVKGLPEIASLGVGETMKVPRGELTLEDVRKYAGIYVSYNPFENWILVASILCGFFILLHYIGRLRGSA